MEAATDGQIADGTAKTSCTAAKVISLPCTFLARKRGDPLRCALRFDSLTARWKNRVRTGHDSKAEEGHETLAKAQQQDPGTMYRSRSGNLR